MPSFSRRRIVLGGLALVFLGVLGLAVPDWCGDWPARGPRIEAPLRATGTLRVGAGSSTLSPSLPASIAGYGPPRSEATTFERPLFARALVLESDGLRVGLLNLDLLSAPAALTLLIREGVEGLGLDALWVSATHTHSSFGGYDDGHFAQIVGMGRERADAKDAAVMAAKAALEGAVQSLTPATLAWGEQEVPGLSVPRTGERADTRLSRMAFREASAPSAGGAIIGEIVVLAAHPTLAGRPRTSLHPDYPGLLAQRGREHGVMLVLQGAGGNSAARLDPDLPRGDAAAAQFAERAGQALSALPMQEEKPSLAFVRAQIDLPRPDLSRPVPRPWNRPVENLLCWEAPRHAEVSLLRIGTVSLLALPFEPSFEAAQRLERELPHARLVSLVDGYLGYLEPAGRVERGEGEARRQYFRPELLDRLVEGVTQMVRALETGGP